jgi:hypothetical protein
MKGSKVLLIEGPQKKLRRPSKNIDVLKTPYILKITFSMASYLLSPTPYNKMSEMFLEDLLHKAVTSSFVRVHNASRMFLIPSSFFKLIISTSHRYESLRFSMPNSILNV